MEMTPGINKEIFKDLLGENPVVLDIGSYDGKDAAELAEILQTEVHCFEPDDGNISKIKSLKNDMLIVWKHAICAWHGKGPYVRSKNHPQSNSMHAPLEHTKIFPGIKFSRRSYMVNCTTLDSWRRSVLKNKPIDLIWCDVNGAEGDVIMGATQTLKETKYLYIEFQTIELYKGALNKEQLLDRLPDFELVGVYNESPSYGNMLLRNKILCNQIGQQ